MAIHCHLSARDVTLPACAQYPSVVEARRLSCYEEHFVEWCHATGCAVDMSKAVHRRAARRKERVRKLDVDRVAAESLSKLKQVRAWSFGCTLLKTHDSCYEGVPSCRAVYTDPPHVRRSLPS